MLSRRQFLAGASTLALLPAARVGAASDLRLLRAVPATLQIAPQGYAATPVWSFDGQLPGAPLRFVQGDRLQIRVVNDLPQATAVHWHGIRVPNAMDGVPDLTQAPIEPGASFDYDFTLPDAGTYWYHSHMKSMEQVERGLYGPLIIEEATPPDVDADIVLMLDDILLGDDAAIVASFDNPHDQSHAGRYGNVMLTNGQMGFTTATVPGARLRLRLVNAATARILTLGLKGMTGWVVAYDGMPLAAPEPLADDFVLAPAQRMDLIVDVTAAAGDTAHLVHFERDGGYAQASFDVTGVARVRRTDPPAALPPNPGQLQPDLAAATDVEVRMEGGAMRGLRTARYQGREMDGRALMAEGQFWTLAGQAGLPEAPLADVARGQTVRMTLVNDTAFPHAMHLHGMHFHDLLPAGGLGPMRDTLLVDAGETRRIAFVADNPGSWLFHCHMLAHAASGMISWIRVA